MTDVLGMPVGLRKSLELFPSRAHCVASAFAYLAGQTIPRACRLMRRGTSAKKPSERDKHTTRIIKDRGVRVRVLESLQVLSRFFV